MNFSRISLLVGAATAVSILTATSPAHALEFVQNGGFDSNGTGWSSTNGSFTSGTSFNSGTISGNYWLTVATSSSPATLSQTINGLTVGNTYNFAFNWAQFTGTPNGIVATLGSQTLATLSNLVNQGTLFSTVFVADSATSMLTFSVFNDPGIAFIDNISISTSTPVPFDIPGGATIPTVGGLLALGLMRKARKSLASNTRFSDVFAEAGCNIDSRLIK